MTRRPRKPRASSHLTTPASDETYPRPNPETPLEGEVVPIPAEAERRLKAAGADPADPRIQTAIRIGRSFAGPIPPPDILEEYRSVNPELPQKIITWNETQRDHRMSLELAATRGSERRMDRGQLFTFIIAALGLVLATVEGIFGSTPVAVALAVVSIGGPTAAFVMARAFRWESGDNKDTPKKKRDFTRR